MRTLSVNSPVFVKEEHDEIDDCELPITPDGKELSSTLDVHPLEIFPELTNSQISDINKLVNSFADVFSEVPGCTTTLQHDIQLVTGGRLKSKVYPVPIHLQSYFEEKVDKLLAQGITTPSASPHCSPVVMVKKSDGSYRMAIDFRSLNSVTIFLAEPRCNVEDDLYKFQGAKYFTHVDLTKAY